MIYVKYPKLDKSYLSELRNFETHFPFNRSFFKLRQFQIGLKLCHIEIFMIFFSKCVKFPLRIRNLSNGFVRRQWKSVEEVRPSYDKTNSRAGSPGQRNFKLIFCQTTFSDDCCWKLVSIWSWFLEKMETHSEWAIHFIN